MKDLFAPVRRKANQTENVSDPVHNCLKIQNSLRKFDWIDEKRLSLAYRENEASMRNNNAIFKSLWVLENTLKLWTSNNGGNKNIRGSQVQKYRYLKKLIKFINDEFAYLRDTGRRCHRTDTNTRKEVSLKYTRKSRKSKTEKRWTRGEAASVS